MPCLLLALPSTLCPYWRHVSGSGALLWQLVPLCVHVYLCDSLSPPVILTGTRVRLAALRFPASALAVFAPPLGHGGIAVPDAGDLALAACH